MRVVLMDKYLVGSLPLPLFSPVVSLDFALPLLCVIGGLALLFYVASDENCWIGGPKMRLTVLTTALLSATTTTFVSALVGGNGTYDASIPSLFEADLEALVKGLEKGVFSSVDLVEAYTARSVKPMGRRVEDAR